MVKHKITLFFLLLTLSVISQNMDTIRLYENRTSEPLNKWRYSAGQFSYCSFVYPMTSQDSLWKKLESAYVDPFLLIILDKKDRKFLEGEITGSSYFLNKVKFYYTNGNIERIESYDTIARNNCLVDGVIRIGTWQYFNNEGKLIKTERYFYERKNTTDTIFMETQAYDASGNKKGKLKLSKYRCRDCSKW